MNKMRSTWLKHKHDILAGSFATVLTIFVLQLVFGGSTPHEPIVVVAQSSPPALGVKSDAAEVPDTLAHAGVSENEVDQATSETVEESEETDSLNETTEVNSEAPESDDTAPPMESNSESAEQPIVEQQNSANVATNKSDENAGEHTGSANQVAEDAADKAANQSKPNPVESAPKPVEQMSAAEMQAAVEAYEAWIHKGDIKLLLDYSRLSVQQLNSIAQLYVASTRHHTLWITPDGQLKDIEQAEVPAGKLVGDLPIDRTKWPPVLVQRARERFGRSFVAKANFLLSDGAALQLYRTLAEAVGNEEPQEGTQVMLRLQPNGEQIDVQLVRYK